MNNCDNSRAPFEPGWNDPPTFSYSTQQTTPNRPRNFLNKRVAFPLSGGSTVTGPMPPVILPPIPTVPVSCPQKRDSTILEDYQHVDSESTLTEVKNILLEFLESSAELGPKANDIKRRINTMKEMWTSGKLNKQIHFQMNELACALRDDQPSKADEIHRALMVDHVSAVGSWMPGIKQLIHHCMARSELLAIDKE